MTAGMTPYEALRRLGVATAREVASACGMMLEDVYLDLVRAEARGLARVRVEYVYGGGGGRYALWEVCD